MARRLLHLVVSVVFVVVGAFLTWHGGLRLLANVPAAGVSGPVTVAHCAPVSRGAVTCTGTFTPPDGEPWTVTVEGADRAGLTFHAKVYPWDKTRAYVWGETGSIPGAVGTTAFGGAVLVLGVVGVAVLAGQVRRSRRTPETERRGTELNSRDLPRSAR